MGKIRTLTDLGAELRKARHDRGIKAVDVAKRSGRSRDILHRLETGHDISAGSLLDIMRAMNLALEIVPSGVPTLREMSERFGGDEDAS